MLIWILFYVMNIFVNFIKFFLYKMLVDFVFFGKLFYYSNFLVNFVIYCFKIFEFRIVIRFMFCKNWVREICV